jgi:hypothetical protein
MQLVNKILIITSLLCIFYSCKSDDDLKKEANEFVNKFVNELLLKNYDYINKVYPEFEGFSYWIPREFDISETIIESDESITVYGTYHKNKINIEQIKFNLIQENDSYIIRNTKGLSSYFNSALYDYCNKKGYFNKSNADFSIDNDVDVAKVCKDKEFELDLLIDNCIQYVLSNVHLNKHQSNLSLIYFDTSISGDIQIQNNTAFKIGSSNFNFFLNLLSNNKVCNSTELSDLPYINIEPFSSYNHKIFYLDNPCKSSKYSVQLELYNRDGFASEVVEKLDYAESL